MCRFGVPALAGETHTNTMILKIFNALEMVDAAPAEAGTPNPASLAKLETEIQQGMMLGVPPSGGGAIAYRMNMEMNMEILNALDMATALPAKAGTPYEAEIQQGMTFGVPALAGKGMKELEGMLR